MNKVKILSEERAKSDQKYILQYYFTRTIFSNSTDSDQIDKNDFQQINN